MLKKFVGEKYQTADGIAEVLADAERFLKSARQGGRSLSEVERADLKARLDQIEDAQDTLKINEAIEAMRTGSKSGSVPQPFGLGSALSQTGFDVKNCPSVDVPPGFLLKSTFPAVTDVARSSPTLVPMGRDSRWLYPLLPRQNVAGELSIQDFKQTARTVTGTVERSPIAATDKAQLDVTLELVNEALKQEAILIPGVPLELVEAMTALQQYLNAEGTFQVEKALDLHVFAQIVAAAPPFGTSGTGLVAKIRNGVATMRAEGANPDIVVVNATDAAALDLETDAGGYIFATRESGVSSPLWGLKVVERTSAAGNEPPYLIDSRMLGVLFLGNLRFDADPFAGFGGKNFARNLVDLRVETTCLFHVRDAKGARRIAAT